MYKPLRLIIAVFLWLTASAVNAQYLSIVSFGGNLPLNDTALESIPLYTFNIIIANDTTVPFYDTLDIFIRANAHPPDYLYQGLGPDTIIGLDSIQINPPGYHFDQQHFDDGDNIVVIWPAARSQPVEYDSIVAQVYFQSVISVEETDRTNFNIFPNPATDYIYLEDIDKTKTKRVRIYDIIGKQYFNQTSIGKFISIKYLKAGIYFIDLERMDGRRSVITFVKS